MQLKKHTTQNINNKNYLLLSFNIWFCSFNKVFLYLSSILILSNPNQREVNIKNPINEIIIIIS